MIIFENAGTLDDLALFTMGLNAKENDSAIGFFGTGLKYAISIICRKGGTISIQPGDGTEHPIVVSPINFRGKDFTVMHYRGKQLPFTTELGKNWKVWQAYRELYTNALDEGGQTYFSSAGLAPVVGTVRIIVRHNALETIHDEKDLYFWNSVGEERISPKLALKREGEGKIFYRGILVGALTSPSNKNYNLETGITLSEDRTMMNEYEVTSGIVSAIVEHGSTSILTEFLTAVEETAEHGFSWGYSLTDGSTALEIATEIYRTNVTALIPSAQRTVGLRNKAEITFVQEKISDAEQRWIDTIEKLFELQGWELKDVSWKVRINEKHFGLTVKGKIYIGSLAFEQGFRQVLMTVLEEYIHQRYFISDFTRAFQDKVLVLLAAELENKI